MRISAQQLINNSKDPGIYVTSFKHLSSSSSKKGGREGDIYVLLKIASGKKLPLDRVGKFVIDSIVDGYLYSMEKTSNAALKDAIDGGVNKVRELMKNDKDLEQTGIDIDFTLVLFKKEGVYIGVFGNNDVFFFKKNKIIDLNQIIAEKKANTVGIILSEGDVLMASTDQVLKNSLMHLSKCKNATEIRENLVINAKSFQSHEGIIYFVGEETEEPVSIVQMEEEKERTTAEISKVETIYVRKKTDLKKVLKKISIPKNVTILLGNFLTKIKVLFLKIGKFLHLHIGHIWEKITNSLSNKRWYKKLGSRISEIKISRRSLPRREGIRIDGYKSKELRNKRLKVTALIILSIVLLAAGINFSINTKKQREISNLANEKFVLIEDFLGKVEEDFATDKENAETFLFKAENTFSEVPAGLSEEDQAKYDDLKKRSLELGDSLYKRVAISESSGSISSFLDPRLNFGEGSDPVDIDIFVNKGGEEYLLVSDKEKNVVHKILISSKSVESLPDSDSLLQDPVFLSIGVNGIYVYDSRVGVLKSEFDGDGGFKSFVELSGLTIDDIRAKEVVDMNVLTEADNIYLLSKDLSTILKSTAAYGDRYGLSYPYVDDLEFSEATDFAGDLGIYVISSLGDRLIRYIYSPSEQKQVKSPLGTGGFDGNYGNITKIFTDKDDMNKGLYVFDAEGKRFLRFEKPLEGGADIRHPNQVLLLKQYTYRGEQEGVFSDVRDFVVDSQEENMYVLEGSVIWKVSL